MEAAMMDVGRRSALAFGLTAVAATPLFSTLAFAEESPKSGPEDGKDIGHGRRLVEVGTRPFEIAAYKEINIIDVVYAPGADDGEESKMDMDIVCHITAGELDV